MEGMAGSEDGAWRDDDGGGRVNPRNCVSNYCV